MFCMYISTQLASQLAMKHPAQLVLTKYVKIDGRNRSDKFHDFVDASEVSSGMPIIWFSVSIGPSDCMKPVRRFRNARACNKTFKKSDLSG